LDRIGRCFELIRDLGVELGVNATDEETLPTLAMRLTSAPASGTRGQTFDVSVCDLFVNVAREKQGDVDVMLR